jgi:hypothetical protein
MNNTEYVAEKANLLILGKDASLKIALRMEIYVGLAFRTSQKLHINFPKAPPLFPVTES